jgi:NADH-quinone oxidoreductase subunit A
MNPHTLEILMYELVPVVVLGAFVAAFGLFLVVLTNYLGNLVKAHYGRGTNAKYEPYECGLEPQSKGDTKISVKFYLTAILFIIFDIEIIFMYPWAITFVDFIDTGLGLQAFFAMGLFLLIFVFGLVWEVASNALDWE